MSLIRILCLALILSAPAGTVYAQYLDPQAEAAEAIQNAINACEGKKTGDACSYYDALDQESLAPTMSEGQCKPSDLGNPDSQLTCD